ncbi:F-box only protein 8-like [Saccoglossus kowalevskii]|uniref:F-box only protein 8-like n=1 Tax=Saccoglossus kowalevskii TaxID=10224 RepID=A0ABM0GN16_SACKO|nr:PREDICTED: F-box only protein 8-like [Saccoglossus kowalevskii]
MGQSLKKANLNHRRHHYTLVTDRHRSIFEEFECRFPDICDLPPELALIVLSNLNATELCLAACVNQFWASLAKDEMLWEGLCRATWGCVSAYRKHHGNSFSFRKLYLDLDEGTLTFNADPELGMQYLLNKEIVDNNALSIAQFIHTTNRLDRKQVRIFVDNRRDVLDELINLHNYANKFLANALRLFFSNIDAPSQRSNELQTLIEKFASRFIDCNPSCGLTAETIYVLCYSLILLSVDLTSPHVKNKMSKREFIRNVRRAAVHVDDEFSGHLYDNIYLVGHIAPQRW